MRTLQPGETYTTHIIYVFQYDGHYEIGRRGMRFVRGPARTGAPARQEPG